MKLTEILSRWGVLLACLLGATTCSDEPLPGAFQDASSGPDAETSVARDAGVPGPPDAPAVVDLAPDAVDDVPIQLSDTSAGIPVLQPDASKLDLQASNDHALDGPAIPTDAPPCPIYTSDCRGPRCEVPIDWNTALQPATWWNSIMYFNYSVVLCHTGKGYDQVVGSQRMSLDGQAEIRRIYLYDAVTGRFVQKIWVGDPATHSIGCELRADDAPEVAVTLAPLPCETIVPLGGKEDADVLDL